VLRGVYPPFAGWLYPALAPILFPWYMVWAVPYALAARSGALLTLLALPVLATLVDTTYDLRPVALALFALGVGALLVGVSKSPEALEPASG
jgi:H+/gluconate symporter-like permease